MEQLAIKGHARRRKEVIEILEMLGGNNYYKYNGASWSMCYYIDKEGYIICDTDGELPVHVHIFTLEEFLKKFPYKIGDKVVDINGLHGTIATMSWDECICTVRYDLKYEGSPIKYHGYTALMLSTDEEKLIKQPILTPTLDSATGEILYFTDKTTNKNYYPNEPSDLSMECPDGFEFIDENGNVITSKKIKLERKKTQYPKTYKECCKIIHSDPNVYIDTHLYSKKLDVLYKLLICRDAYCKIAGDWRYDVNKTEEYFYIVNKCGRVVREHYMNFNHILAFPTEEMRDAFYENFKELIESCKELL